MDLIRTHQVSVADRLNAVSLQLQPGQIMGLIGPNGAGKSTLLHAISGIVESTGDIKICGDDVRSLSHKEIAQRIGLQLQQTQSAWSLRVRDVVALGRTPWADEDVDAINEAMTKTEILELADRNIDELSGGEKARVWLARVLAGRPKVILADEPIASLDLHYQLDVMNLLRKFAQQDRGVIVAIHDLSLAARFCDKLCLLHRGVILSFGEVPSVLTEDNLQQAFGIGVDVDLQRNPPLVLPR